MSNLMFLPALATATTFLSTEYCFESTISNRHQVSLQWNNQGLIIIAGAHRAPAPIRAAKICFVNTLKIHIKHKLMKYMLFFQIYYDLCNGKNFVWIVIFLSTI